MASMFRSLVALLVLVAVIFGGAYLLASRGIPPQIVIVQPDRLVGQTGLLEVTATAPNARFVSLTITLEQNGKTVTLYALNGAQTATIRRVNDNQLNISRPIGKQSLPELQAGAARIVVTATRPPRLNIPGSLLPKGNVTSTATKDIQVRLEPPRIAVLSTHHYVNHGGSEMVVYKATPADIASGVRVGDVEYPGFPASGAGVDGADPSIKVAFFALLYDQPLNTRS